MSKFKEVNDELASYNKPADTSRSAASLVNDFPTKELYNQIILLTDSLKEMYSHMPDAPQRVSPSPAMEKDIRRLLDYIRRVNKLEWDMMDSSFPDTISYWKSSTTFNPDKWYGDFFNNQYKIQAVTYLGYLKSQAEDRMEK